MEAQSRAVLREQPRYGYRRARALVNRTSGTRCGRKRNRHVMALAGLTLP